MVSKKTFATIKALYEEENGIDTFPPFDSVTRFSLRSIMFDTIGNEEIPIDLFGTCLAFSLSCYDETGKGYNGIQKEIKKRLRFFSDIGVESLPLTDFFKHSAKEYDLFDDDNSVGYEIKTGCGNWLYSQFSDLDLIRKEKEESGERLIWNYHYTKKSEKEFSFTIKIETDWKHFFDYLDTYEKGYKTFFKYNKSQSIKCGCSVYEMNTIKTSKKKVKFLRAFYEIN